MEYAEEDREETSDPFSINDNKSLAQWRFELRTLPKRHWNVYYSHFLGKSISNYALFFRAIKLYGDMNVFEAVLATARQSLEGDPLNYVLKITHSLWRAEQLEEEKQKEADKIAREAIEISKKRNKELAAKLKKLKRK